MTRLNASLLALALWVGLIASGMPAHAGEIDDGRYVATRFTGFEAAPPAGQWQFTDRETGEDDAYGGPVVDLASTRPAGGIYPVVLVSAFRKADPAVTADFILRASRETMAERGAESGPVLVRQVNGRKVWHFDVRLQQKGKPMRLYYVLMSGENAFFAAQALAPEAAYEALQQQVNDLLPYLNY